MAMRRMALATAALFAGAAVFAAGYLLFGIGPHRIDWYRVDTPDSMTVELTTGPNPWIRVADVTEASTSVTVVVKVFDLRLGPGTAAGYPHELSVRLAQPLGSRLVYDGNGEEVPEYHPPQP